MLCVPGRPVVLPQPGQVLQIQTPRAVTANVVTMPTLGQDRPVPVAAPSAVSVTLRCPSSDEDVSPIRALYHFPPVALLNCTEISTQRAKGSLRIITHTNKHCIAKPTTTIYNIYLYMYLIN